jgi:hypothetical protein
VGSGYSGFWNRFGSDHGRMFAQRNDLYLSIDPLQCECIIWNRVTFGWYNIDRNLVYHQFAWADWHGADD